MRLPFIKTQSIGNDFVLIHAHDAERLLESARRMEPAKVLVGSGVQLAGKRAITDMDALLARLAILVSDRRFGIGSDGLLVMSSGKNGVSLRMFNPDGTEDFCGNGLRCVAICAAEEGLVTTSAFRIEHRGFLVDTELLGGGLVRTLIGKADYTPSKVPVVSQGEIFRDTVWSGMIDGMPQSFAGSALTTGSTHVIIPTGALPDDHSFASISSAIEVDPKFPEHTSVIWVQEEAPKKVAIRIWERGAGETLGCGTGAAAAAADYMRRREVGGSVEVKSKGGTVKVTMPRWDAPIMVEGSAEIIYSGVYDVPADAWK